MAFYEFRQNNSGGFFITNETVCHFMIIEATDHAAAVKKAEELGCYWDGCAKGIDCPCCGDRWSIWDDEPLYFENETVEEHAERKAEKWAWTHPGARIFYLNGEVKEF